MKQAIGLIIGVLVGAAGGYLFSNSQAPEAGSLEERVEVAEREATKYRGYYEAIQTDVDRNKDTSRDRLKETLRKLKEGEEVTFDDIFASMKPWMRDMSPIFQRLQTYNGEEFADAEVGKWVRKYEISQNDRKRLKQWFSERHQKRSEQFNAILQSEQSGFVDFVQATEYDWRDAEDIDQMMETILKGDDLENFKAEQLTKRIESVEAEANRNITRLDEIVGLEREQSEAVFGLMARSSRDYRENLEFDGMANDTTRLNRRERDQKLADILTPEQNDQLKRERQRRREEAEQDLSRMGLGLPRDWDLLEGDSF